MNRIMLVGVSVALFCASCACGADALLSPTKAAEQAAVPDQFRVSVFASEPDVRQPIGFCIDDRNRIWVAEAYNYPNHGSEPGDRILILEDRDGDGKHDHRKVFFEGLNYVTGIEVGFGGAWVVSPPSLYFIPDKDGDDIPDGKPVTVLDGFGTHANAHNLANGLAWGPDGWLYGTHGRTNWSMIGKPGTPDDQRVRFDGGVYRYHPVRGEWESYADGTTNPWGIDWNDYGHAFTTNCVNPHLFQVIQGAHYEPWRNRKSSQYAYQRIDTIADHLHFRRNHDSKEEDEAGGGHAHCGTMIYLGDQFPAQYRNSLFTNNVHGRRINNDLLRRRGSGYIASHGQDFFRSADPWFMGVTIAYGAGGEVYVSDWSDTGECHSIKNTRKETGRIYRITYGDQINPSVDLSKLSNRQLAELQLHSNDWMVRHSRRLLHERATAGGDVMSTISYLTEIYQGDYDIPAKLRSIWALNVIGGINETFLRAAIEHPDENIRAWAITFMFEDRHPPSQAGEALCRLAQEGSSPLVRLSLASAIARLELPARWQFVDSLATRAEDQDDANLPLMLWYACEPLINDDLARFARLASDSRIPRLRINIARRIASSKQSVDGLELLSQSLAESIASPVADDLLDGILSGLDGKRGVSMPESWPAAFKRLARDSNADIQEKAIRLAVVFDDQTAMQHLRAVSLDAAKDAGSRRRAIDALVGRRWSGYDEVLLNLVGDPVVRGGAIKGLAAYNHPRTSLVLLDGYPRMSPADQQLVHATLASRVDWAKRLLSSVEKHEIPAAQITAYTARQIRSIDNSDLTKLLHQCWGEIRETPKDKAKRIKSIKKRLSSKRLADADLDRGKQLFAKQCGTCHRFFGQGGNIGPDITGSQRSNLDYMLENIVDPSAAVAKDYQMQILQTDEGRIVTGLIESETQDTITIQTVNERLVFPIKEIVGRKKSEVSMMPQGLLEPLSEEEIRDLFAYLQSAAG